MYNNRPYGLFVYHGKRDERHFDIALYQWIINYNLYMIAYNHDSSHPHALEGSGENFKYKDSNNAFWSLFWSKYGRFFLFFGTLHGGGGGAGFAPL